MGDDQPRGPAGEARRPRRWPLPGATRTPPDTAADEPSPLCFTPVHARPVDAALTRPEYATVRRGYDPRQVDEHVEALSARAAAAETERYRADIAEDELRAALTELKAARSRTAPAPGRPGPTGPDRAARGDGDEGFGLRVERMLREAEREAEQERDAAARQAADILARAHAEAESHRREVERALAERLAALDDETIRRDRELAEREREVGERLAAARSEAAEITSAAEAEAARRAREMLEHAGREAAARRDRTNREVERLTGVRDGVHAELVRLRRDLARQLGLGRTPPEAGVADDPTGGPGPNRRDPPAPPDQRTGSALIG